MTPSPKPVSASTRVAGVIGWPVDHSLSPALHNAAYAAAGIDAVYVALPVAPERVNDALSGARALGFLGLNVTTPHKQAAWSRCARLADTARATRAVNTVVVAADGALVGHNTDVSGFGDAVDEADPHLRGTRAVVLGAGGAARAVVVALRQRGCLISVVVRDPQQGLLLLDLGAIEVMPWLPSALESALTGARLLVDATSSGLSEVSEHEIPAPVPLARLEPDALVCSLVYHREPALLKAARAGGWRTLDGRPMLLYQAAHAFTLMTGQPAPVEVMRAALRA